MQVLIELAQGAKVDYFHGGGSLDLFQITLMNAFSLLEKQRCTISVILFPG